MSAAVAESPSLRTPSVCVLPTHLRSEFGEIADGLATVEEAAAFLNVSRSQVYALADAGHLKSRRLGGVCRILWRSIAEYASADHPPISAAS